MTKPGERVVSAVQWFKCNFCGLMPRVQHWVQSWLVMARHYRMMRTKKHGGGALPVLNALRLASLSRYGIYHQHYSPLSQPLGWSGLTIKEPKSS